MEVLQHLRVDRASSVPIQTQIARQLERLIASDALTVGHRLPPIRELARQLEVNLHTVRAAYRRLQAQGFVEVMQGRGTTVKEPPLAGFTAGRSIDRSFAIGVVLPALVSFYAPVLAGMYEAGENDPSRILVGFADERVDSAESHVRFFAGEADGIIVVSQTLRGLHRSAATPRPAIVFADWPGSPTPSITFSSSPMGDLVGHLVSHGHTDIDLITPPSHHPNIRPLIATYREAASRLGVATRDPVEVLDWTMEEGGNAMTRILESEHPPSAVMAATDPLALGAMRAARHRGLSIGRDIALTGYGDTDVSGLVDPGLTTVRLPARRLGYTAMQRLLDLMDRKPVEPLTELTGTIIKRQSCGCDEASS